MRSAEPGRPPEPAAWWHPSASGTALQWPPLSLASGAGTRCQRSHWSPPGHLLAWGACPGEAAPHVSQGVLFSGCFYFSSPSCGCLYRCAWAAEEGRASTDPSGALAPMRSCKLWHQGKVLRQGAVHLYALKCLRLEMTGMIYLDVSFFSQELLFDWMEKELNPSPDFSFCLLLLHSQQGK